MLVLNINRRMDLGSNATGYKYSLSLVDGEYIGAKRFGSDEIAMEYFMAAKIDAEKLLWNSPRDLLDDPRGLIVKIGMIAI